MIEMAAEGLCLELIGEFAARLDHARARHAVHARGMNAVEMHRMRMGAAIVEPDAQALAFGAAQGRARHAAIIGPAGEFDARRDFEFVVDRGDRPFADNAAVGIGGDGARVPVGEDRMRIEAVLGVVDLADNEIVVPSS